LHGLIDDAGGLADDADLMEWCVELGVVDFLVGDPYRRKDGLVEEAPLDRVGAEVEVVDVVAEDGEDQCERVLDLPVVDVQAFDDGCRVEAFERGEFNLSVDTVLKIAAALEMTACELFGRANL
jgi:hypothetical protein